MTDEDRRKRVLRQLDDEREEELRDLARSKGLVDPDATKVADLKDELRRRALDRVMDAGVVEPEDLVRARLDPSRALGRYTLVDLLGQGGAGTVWRAWDNDLRRWVAAKLPRAPISDTMRARFLQEARIAAGLRHPNLVAVHDVGVAREQPFLVMELIKGRPMSAAAGLRPFVQVLRTVAAALETAHGQGIIHRDLKPANILVDERNVPHVVDFGLARTEDPASGVTRPGATVGTPLYMAPEQVRGGKGVSPRTDVYSLGVILYEGLTGRVPHGGDSEMEIFEKILQLDPLPPRRLRPETPADLEAVCLKALEKDPAKRYASAGDVAAELDRWLDGQPVLAKPRTLFSTIRRRVSRHRWRYAAGAIATVVVVAIVAQVRGMSQQLDLRDRVSQVSSAWYELTLKSAEPMRRLEDAFNRGEGVDVDEALRQVEAAVRAVSTRHPSLQLPRAWRGLAVFHAGREEEGLREIDAACAAAGPDPFPHVLRASADLERSIREIALPDIAWNMDTDGGRVDSLDLSPSMLQHQAAAAAAIERSQALGVWPLLDHGREIEAFAEGILMLSRRDTAGAAARFATLSDDPLLRGQAAVLEGLAHYLAGRQESAAAAWSRVTARGWPVMRYFAGMARVYQLLTPAGRDVDPEAAVAALEEVVRRGPGYADKTRRSRAIALLYKSRFEARQGRDPRDAVARALAACEEQHDGKGRYFTACIAFVAGRDEYDRRGDARPLMERVIAELDAVGADIGVRRIRGAARMVLGTIAEVRGEDPTASWQAAAADFDLAVAEEPLDHANRATVHSALAVWRARRSLDFEADRGLALAAYAEALKGKPRFERMLESRAQFYEDLANQLPDPPAELRKAIADVTLLIGIASSGARFQRRGGLELRAALAELARKADPDAAYGRAIADCTKALDLDAKLDQAYVLRAVATMSRGQRAAAAGGDPAGYYATALDDLNAALRLRESASAYSQRGILMNLQRRMREAVADMEKSLELNPNQPEIRRQVELYKSRREH